MGCCAEGLIGVIASIGLVVWFSLNPGKGDITRTMEWDAETPRVSQIELQSQTEGFSCVLRVGVGGNTLGRWTGRGADKPTDRQTHLMEG